MSKYKKPNWYPESDIIAAKSGWAYTKNHNEILNAIPRLDDRIKAEEEGSIIRVSSVTLDHDILEIIHGTTGVLKHTIMPVDASDMSVTWSSSDSLVATVNNGIITTLKGGSTVITVTTTDGPKTDTASITVIVKVDSVTLDAPNATIVVGGTQQLTPSVLPSGASNKNVTYTSSVIGVATVSPTGLVTGVSSGSTIITVTTVDGSKTSTSNITVR